MENSAIDPVSKNPVPPGATPKEVRDDVPIMASEGEYVIPANVVRFLGLDKIEKMVNDAKEKLQELDAKGRIGGEGPDDLPFSPEELQAVEEQPPVAQMATGGMVQNPMDIDPETGLPWWMLSRQQVSPYESKRGESSYSPPTGMAASVDKWSTEDLMKYGNARNSVGQGVGQMFASLIPFGGLAAKARERYLERAVPERIKAMLDSGKDEQGNSLTPEQVKGLQESYDKSMLPMSTTPVAKVVRGIGEETGLIKPRSPSKEKTEAYNKKVRGDSFVNRAVDKVTATKSSTKKKEDRR